MFSGKTTELMRRIKRYQIANYKCLLIKYAKDLRYDKENLCTHDQQTLGAVSATSLWDLIGEIEKYKVVGIDEVLEEFITLIVGPRNEGSISVTSDKY